MENLGGESINNIFDVLIIVTTPISQFEIKDNVNLEGETSCQHITKLY